MKFIAILAILALCTPAAITQAAVDAPADQPRVWTTRQAVAYAIAENPDSSIARKKIAEAQAFVALARVNDYPQLNLAAEYGQTNNPMYAFGNILNQGAFNEDIDFNAPGTTDNLQLKAQLSYQLYDWGRDRAGRTVAQAGVERSTADLLGVHRQLGFEVVRAFYTIVQAKNMVSVREESLTAISASLGVARARFEAGDLLRQDLLNLELQQSIASENLIRSRHQLELSRQAFANLLGLTNAEIVVSEGDSQDVPEQLDYQNRHELQQLAAREAAARGEVERARSGQLPTLETFADYQVNKGWTSDEGGDSWMAGVRMQYALFDGHHTATIITLAKLQVQELQALRQKIELALELDIEQAKLDYQQARERVQVTEKMVKVAEEVARLSRARFREGVILASDLIDFELRLSDAQARYLAADTGYRTSVANLRRATGLAQFPDEHSQ